ncbi:aminotransferase-like domain-containing protein [Pseudomonas triticifolii]|uniref:PLP-dependent aminotransferase family protein n=1 Tax=Pseudomonas triticifolii TaxID=2762592 RepID=A0ABR7B8P4_9PSED|nr:PLP-dependent aminotransferase family protein [Pseudomonas triticifolii]MBC3953551.1 PLP-dependent aminotransferase family protein [Pseudomonas triticifolii]
MKNKTDFAYQAVYRYLLRLVNDAQEKSPFKLPSLRQLARRLRVSISTVQSAYSLLEKEGRICSMPKSGYYTIAAERGEVERPSDRHDDDLLSAMCRSARRPGMWVIGDDEPTVVQFQASPLIAMERELARHYPRLGSAGFQPFGDVELRTALAARYTRDAGHGWYADDVYIAADLSSILKAVIETLGLRETHVLVESPCPWGLLRLLQAYDIRIVELPLDESGSLDLVVLDQVLEAHTFSVAILPSVLNPVCGRIRPWSNTQAVAERLERHKVRVLENDSHGDLSFTREQGRLRDMIDPCRLIIMGSFAKALGPEAPFGYVLCKNDEREWQRYFLVHAFELPPMRQKAIARLCASGQLDTYLSGLVLALGERMLEMNQGLDRHLAGILRYERPAGGSAFWAECSNPVSMRQVFDDLLGQRIVIMPGELFSANAWHRQHLRIGYAIDWSQDIDRLLATLRTAFEQARTP